MISRAKSLLLAFSLTLGLTGCFWNAPEERVVEEEDFVTLVGRFKPLGSIQDLEEVTNIFEDEDGEVYYAYSNRYNLNDESYKGEDFEVYGLLTHYKNLDKSIFEVRKISLLDENGGEEEDASSVEYKDVTLGLSFSHPSVWEVASLDSHSIHLTSEENADTILLSRLEWTVSKTSLDLAEDRIAEIQTLVHTQYPNLKTAQGNSSFVGPDRLFAVRFEVTSQGIYYFVPRQEELYLLSLSIQDEEDSKNQAAKNTFSSLLNGFRFLPMNSEIPSQEPGTPSPTPTGEQVSFSKYASLKSETFGFAVSYPSSWYYVGMGTSFQFQDSSFEDSDTEGILSLSLNSGKTAGVQKSGSKVEITKIVEGKAYTFAGPSEYQSVLQSMSDSFQLLEEDTP